MHRGGEIAAHAHDHVVKNQRPGGVQTHRDDFLVGQTEGGGFVRRQMNVALGGDDALRKRKLARGADQLHARGVRNVAALAHRGGDAQRARVGQRDLHLRRFPLGAENRYVADGVFGADDVHLFLAGKLAGLGQHFLHRQLVSLAEQRFNLFCGKVYMSGGGFHHNLVAHFNKPSFSPRTQIRRLHIRCYHYTTNFFACKCLLRKKLC